MSGKKIFHIDTENQPKQPVSERVVSERGRKELPPGTKGGENLKPDRHYEHKQHAFDSSEMRSLQRLSRDQPAPEALRVFGRTVRG